jgi:GNAT superfamily N-acetyltransferase
VDSTSSIAVRAAVAADRPWIDDFLAANHSTRVARAGEIVLPLDHSMLIALAGDAPAGLLTYVIRGVHCEVLTLHTVTSWQGVGTALIKAIRGVARDAGCRTVWLVTTNDNLDAIRFYQRRGFRLRALRPGAVDAARRELKPEISEVGDHGIPLRDELELEHDLTEAEDR